MIEVRRTYKYRLYRCDKRDKHLHRQITVAGTIWNHALVLQKRYYRLTGNYITVGVLKAHIAKLRMNTVHWSAFRPRSQRGDQYWLRRGIGVY